MPVLCVGCEQAVKVLLNSVPEHVQFDGVLEDLQAVRGVTSVHDLHIWAISSKTVSPPPSPHPSRSLSSFSVWCALSHHVPVMAEE